MLHRINKKQDTSNHVYQYIWIETPTMCTFSPLRRPYDISWFQILFVSILSLSLEMVRNITTYTHSYTLVEQASIRFPLNVDKTVDQGPQARIW